MSTRRFLFPLIATSLALSSCSSQPTQATRAEVEAESNRAFNQTAASMPLFADREENQHQLATVIGHEIAHVTAEHALERAGRTDLTNVGVNALAIILGGGYSGATYTAQQALSYGAQLGIALPYSRSKETEADVIGLEYMARAGFDPRESVPLWQRMDASAGRKPAEFMSTHPASDTRIQNLIEEWEKTLPLYNQAQAEGRTPDCGDKSPRFVEDLKKDKEKAAN